MYVSIWVWLHVCVYLLQWMGPYTGFGWGMRYFFNAFSLFCEALLKASSAWKVLYKLYFVWKQKIWRLLHSTRKYLPAKIQKHTFAGMQCRVFAFLGRGVSHCQPSTLTQMMFCWIFGDLVRESTELLGIKQVQIQHFIAINTPHNTPSLLWLGINTVLTLEIEILQSFVFRKNPVETYRNTHKTPP